MVLLWRDRYSYRPLVEGLHGVRSLLSVALEWVLKQFCFRVYVPKTYLITLTLKSLQIECILIWQGEENPYLAWILLAFKIQSVLP